MPKKNEGFPFDRMRAWARVNLAMHPAEFNSLTPEEFFLIADEWTKSDRRRRFDFAQVCWIVAASSGAKLTDGSPFTIGYFLDPAKRVAKKKTKKVPHLRDQFIAALPAHWRP